MALRFPVRDSPAERKKESGAVLGSAETDRPRRCNRRGLRRARIYRNESKCSITSHWVWTGQPLKSDLTSSFTRAPFEYVETSNIFNSFSFLKCRRFRKSKYFFGKDGLKYGQFSTLAPLLSRLPENHAAQ